MNAERNEVGSMRPVIEPKVNEPARPGREEKPEGARGQRSWLGDAPSGQEAGTHVVSRIGVCRPTLDHRWTTPV